jgi:hypothetical protein
MCEYCATWKEHETVYQEGTYCDILISNFMDRPTLVVANLHKGCPKYAECSAKEINMKSAFRINYCPNCGEKMEGR